MLCPSNRELLVGWQRSGGRCRGNRILVSGVRPSRRLRIVRLLKAARVLAAESILKAVRRHLTRPDVGGGGLLLDSRENGREVGRRDASAAGG